MPAVHAPLPGVLPYCYLVITPSRRGTCRHSRWTRCNACDCITFPMAILTMAPYLLWRRTYYGAILTMAPYLLWRHTYYGAVLTMAPYLLWRRAYQAWGDTCIGCRKTSRSLPRVPSGDRCYACKERVYAAERLVAAGEHLLLATTTHTYKFQLLTTDY